VGRERIRALAKPHILAFNPAIEADRKTWAKTMIRIAGVGVVAAALAWPWGGAMAADAPPAAAVAPAPIVFFDIAGPDAAKLRSFYSAAFGWKIGSSNLIGRDSTGGLDGALREDPPQKVLYLGVPDVTAALKGVVEAGGAVVQPRMEIPGVVILGLFTDPAGNAMGLVEMKDGKPIIPAAR
jgi:predicted enzyme related to lactoylglutathione lyase